MSTFSRGCLRRHALSPFQINTFQSIHPPRFFNTTSIVYAKKPRSKPPPPPRSSTTPPKNSLPTSVAPKSPSPISSPSSPLIPYTSHGYADTLARKSHSTLLYEAPSHILFMASAYAGAFFCYSWSAWATSSMVLNAPTGLAVWIPYSFGGVAIMMSAIGTWLIFGTAKCIRRITAIPKRADQISMALNKNTSKAGAQSGTIVPVAEAGEVPELEIEVVMNKMLPIPFFPARVLYLKPGEISLSAQLSAPENQVSAAELRQMRFEEQARLEKEKEFDRNHILTMPFRQMGRAISQGCFAAFNAFKKAWTRDGLTNVMIKGQTYKLDVSGGWILDGGRAIDRLAKIKHRF